MWIAAARELGEEQRDEGVYVPVEEGRRARILAGDALDLGRDRRLHVTTRYGGEGACVYTGRVDWVRIEPGPQAPDSYANRPERLAQRD